MQTTRPQAMSLQPMIGNSPADTLENVCELLERAADEHADQTISFVLRSAVIAIKYDLDRHHH